MFPNVAVETKNLKPCGKSQLLQPGANISTAAIFSVRTPAVGGPIVVYVVKRQGHLYGSERDYDHFTTFATLTSSMT